MWTRIDVRELTLDPIERRARLGVGSDEPLAGEAECIEVLRSAADGAFCATRVPVSVDSGAVLLGGERVESEALLSVLAECQEAYVLVATLGFGADRAIMRRTGAYSAFLIDAVADALVEAVADEACKRLDCKEKLTNRFSPGYADLDISVGRYIIGATGADKLLGVRFTDSGIMTPKKTVSAIVGIKR